MFFLSDHIPDEVSVMNQNLIIVKLQKYINICSELVPFCGFLWLQLVWTSDPHFSRYSNVHISGKLFLKFWDNSHYLSVRTIHSIKFSSDQNSDMKCVKSINLGFKIAHSRCIFTNTGGVM